MSIFRRAARPGAKLAAAKPAAKQQPPAATPSPSAAKPPTDQWRVGTARMLLSEPAADGADKLVINVSVADEAVARSLCTDAHYLGTFLRAEQAHHPGVGDFYEALLRGGKFTARIAPDSAPGNVWVTLIASL
jgi:hypothetical protein